VDPESWWYQGLNYYDLDRYVEAEEAFRNLVAQNPEHGGGLALLGLCEFQNRKYQTAFAHIVLGKEKGIPPGSELDRVAHYHYVMLANKLGQFELASGLLADLARRAPETPRLHEMAGLSALRMPLLPGEIAPGDRERVLLAGQAAVLAWQKALPEALEHAERLLELYPKQPNAHYLKAFILLLMNSEQALEEFHKELEVSPRHVQARLQIAHELRQRGQADKGLPYALEAVKIAPEDFTARNICGRLLLDLDRVKEAIVHLERAVKLAPTSPEAHFHLAAAYGRAGRTAEAAKHRKLFIQHDEARKRRLGETLPPAQR
jgi:tetratricopeptide (TPR) repeat protein